MSYSRSLTRALRAVEQLMGSPAPRTRKKPSSPMAKGTRRTKRAPRPAQAFVPPRTEPDVTKLVETFAGPSLPSPAKLPEAVQASLDEGLIDEQDAAALAELYAGKRRLEDYGPFDFGRTA